MNVTQAEAEGSRTMVHVGEKMPVGPRFDPATPWLAQALKRCLINSFS